MPPREWVQLPSWWIMEQGLAQFRWERREGEGEGERADNTAALMALIVIAHHAEPQTGLARLTYPQLCTAMKISRAKVSNGLTVLQNRGIIRRWHDGRSSLQLVGYDPAYGWCKLPAKPLYAGPTIDAFKHVHLRLPTELNALKLYLLFAAFRDRKTNMANISYDKITEYTGVRRDDIRAAIGMLAALSLAYVERVPSTVSDHGVANSYRLVGLDAHTHMGTIGRRLTAPEFDYARSQADHVTSAQLFGF